jgi:predicted ATP-binding protein involved in virulence
MLYLRLSFHLYEKQKFNQFRSAYIEDGVMKIKRLKLSNFRCFKALDTTFHERMTVFVAPNGGGKSTILDSLAYILSAFVGQFDKDQWKSSKNDDVRIVRKEDGTRALVFPSTLQSEIEVEGKAVSWGRSLMGTEQQSPDCALAAEYGKHLLSVLRSEQPNEAVTLPVIVYYGSTRTMPPEEFKVGLELGSAALMREQGYRNCLNGSANVNLFRTWYGQAAIAELSVQQKISKKEPVPPSEVKLAERARAVKEIVNKVLDGATGKRRYWLDLFLSMKQVGVLDDYQNVELGLHQLSDGVQCMISLVGDLAARCAVLNPHFGCDAPMKTPGVVLIDEVDLHLHPAWQQRVLTDLLKAFPRVQFIVTTHSPQVLSTVHKENVRILTSAGTSLFLDDDTGTYGAESSRMLEEVFSVHSRPQAVETVAQLRQLLSMVENGQAKTVEAQNLRRTLEQALGKHDPDLLMADIRASQLEMIARQ